MCRPRKLILLVDADGLHASELRYVLEIQHYAVEVAVNAAEALAVHRVCDVDLVLGWQFVEDMDAAELADRMRTEREGVPILWMGTEQMAELPWPAAMAQVLPALRTSRMGMLERIRVLIARKRGPKRVRAFDAVPALAGD